MLSTNIGMSGATSSPGGIPQSCLGSRIALGAGYRVVTRRARPNRPFRSARRARSALSLLGTARARYPTLAEGLSRLAHRLERGLPASSPAGPRPNRPIAPLAGPAPRSPPWHRRRAIPTLAEACPGSRIALRAGAAGGSPTHEVRYGLDQWPSAGPPPDTAVSATGIPWSAPAGRPR